VSAPILEIEGLRTQFATRRGTAHSVNGITLSLQRGEILGLVGESGSGKSVTGLSVLGLIEPPGRIVGGQVRLEGVDLVTASEPVLRSIRGGRIAMIFQDPMMTLNPVLSIETQMVEAIRAHAAVSRADAIEWAAAALGRVGIPSPHERLKAYPHQFSGGMRQRVVTAIALLHDPAVVIADEPTTALDVTIQAQILALVQTLVRDSQTAMIWISHDLSVVSGLCDRVAVMYGGRIVELGPTEDVLTRPSHPYTRGLIDSIPGDAVPAQRLRQIPGMPPSPFAMPAGCAFAPRCTRRTAECDADMPPLATVGHNRAARCVHPLWATPE